MKRASFYLSLCCLSILILQATVLMGDEKANPIGRPKQFAQGKQNMYGIWYDDGLWHLKVTSKDHPDKKVEKRTIFTGSIRVNGDIVVGEIVGLDKAKKPADADFVTLDADRKGFTFKLAVFGGVDGINFKLGPKAETVTFNLLISQDDDPKKIWIGKEGQHPEKAKFTLPAAPVGAPATPTKKKKD